MALVFRWYLGLSSRWANAGEAGRQLDYQVWCGPAMGAFNEWAKGSFLEAPREPNGGRGRAEPALWVRAWSSADRRCGSAACTLRDECFDDRDRCDDATRSRGGLRLSSGQPTR